VTSRTPAASASSPAEALIREIEKRHEPPPPQQLESVRHCSRIQVRAGRVVAARMQQHDAARRRRVQFLEHRIEAQPVRGAS
jgi:hypothetical protein